MEVCRGALVVLAVAAMGFVSCSKDDGSPRGCRSSQDCAAGETCEGYQPAADASPSAETLGVCRSTASGGDGGGGGGSEAGVAGHCDGDAKRCSSFSALWSCRDQAGCYWSFASESCSGQPRGCYDSQLYDNKAKCQLQEGCFWKAP